MTLQTNSQCSKCQQGRLIPWANKKGFTCQNCGNLVIIDITSGFECSEEDWAYYLKLEREREANEETKETSDN